MATMFHQHENIPEQKNHSPMRELVLKPGEAYLKTGTANLVDPGVWKGTNSLRILQDETSLWGFKFEKGLLPDPLKQRFTSVSKAINFAKSYFTKRNIEVIEVKDIHATKSWNSSTE
jgi:hypothetical protein